MTTSGGRLAEVVVDALRRYVLGTFPDEALC
jgi:hypothetical protein